MSAADYRNIIYLYKLHSAHCTVASDHISLNIIKDMGISFPYHKRHNLWGFSLKVPTMIDLSIENFHPKTGIQGRAELERCREAAGVQRGQR